MVDISKLYSDLQTTYAGSGVKVEMVRVDAGDSINIGEALRNNKPGTPAATNPENEQKEVVAKEKATYKGSEGMLVRYADGTVEFQISKQKGDSKIQTVLQFKNEKDFQNEKPEKSVTGRVETDAQGNKKFVKTTETSFQYHFNGKISHQETKNGEGKLLNTVDFNTKGKPEKKLVYDKDGNIQTTYKYKYQGNDTQIVDKYDKDNNLLFNTVVKYNGDKRVSSESRYPNGNIAGQSTYDENGKLQSQKDYYENGQLKSDTVYHPNGVIKTQKLYDEQGKVTKNITDEIDGKFDSSAQQLQGDCYLMSSINAIRQMEGGQELLSNLVKITTDEKGEKVYTVTLPGAQKAAEGLAHDGRIKPGSVAISGTYTFTESEMQEILQQAGIKYSIGDGDVILLEAAFEKYRQEVSDTLKANNIDPRTISSEETGLFTGSNENNILSGGKAEDAMFILTGKQSKVFTDNNPKVGLSLEALQAGTATVTELSSNRKMVSTKAATPIEGEVSHQRTELDKMLDEIMKDSEDGHIDNPATVAFKTVNKKGKVGGHAITIKSVTADTVVMVNPWHPDKELVMSREEFLRSAYHLTITSMDDSNVNNDPNKPNNNNNINIPPHIIEIINNHIHSQQNNNGGHNNNGAQNNNGVPNNNGGQNNNSVQNNSGPQNNNVVHHNNNTHAPAVHGSYTIPKNISYTNMIIQMLKDQGIEPTRENITKAKEQFEALNPNAVKTYNGKRADWKGNRYVLYGDKVKVPKFEM